MSNSYVKRLHFFLAGVIRFGLLLNTLVIFFLIAKCLDNDFVDFMFSYDVVPTSQPQDMHGVSIVLTFIFVITFAYSLFGALITGASPRLDKNICYSCLFSTSLILSTIGFGISWLTPITTATWWMIVTTVLLIGTSYFARKKTTKWI